MSRLADGQPENPDVDRTGPQRPERVGRQDFAQAQLALRVPLPEQVEDGLDDW